MGTATAPQASDAAALTRWSSAAKSPEKISFETKAAAK
jgi:hypothetical protein